MVNSFIETIKDKEFQKFLFGLIGGLGIFLYGINLLGESLQALAGNKMKNIIEKLTNNIFIGILVGLVVTAVLQSSSGTTALTISLIRAGLMTMPQAIGIIMGANIGTTATAFLFNFPSISKFSLLFVGFGAIFIFFIRGKRLTTIGQAILGFGLLFYGIDLMGDGLKTVISNSIEIQNLLASFEYHPWLGLLTGTALTGIVQSSSATTGIVQSIVETGQLTIPGAIPIIFGNNIGTTVTTVLAAIGGSIAAKRASLFHVIFNVFGALFFMILLTPFTRIIIELQRFTNASNNLAIAYVHLIFNLVNTLILVWFVKEILWLIKKIIPSSDDLTKVFSEDLFNDSLIEKQPILALENAKKVIIHMANIIKRMLEETYQFVKTPNNKLYDEIIDYETIINSLDQKIHDYLRKINTLSRNNITKYFNTTRDLERISSHCVNLVTIANYIKENKGVFTDEAILEIDQMFTLLLNMLNNCIIIIDSNDNNFADKVIHSKDKFDKMAKTFRKNHTTRVSANMCSSVTAIMFVDLLANLTGIADHCENIAHYSKNDQYYYTDFKQTRPIINIK